MVEPVLRARYHGEVQADGLPPEVGKFISQSVDSVEQLEILMLLARTGSRSWTADEVATTLGLSPISVARNLDALASRQLLSAAPGPPTSYRYAPATDALRADVQRLADAYRDHRTAVINRVASKFLDRIREFSDAFKLKKGS